MAPARPEEDDMRVADDRTRTHSVEDPDLTPAVQTSRRRQPRVRPVDIERQCGVLLGEERRCGAALSCKRHSMGAKRAVAGRSAPFDQLLAASLEEGF
ncbi:SCA7-domain-containing protein [Colletotrichum caudatum]|nr:SCA7-domain-containing protein [Colletotrichum caudatum]